MLAALALVDAVMTRRGLSYAAVAVELVLIVAGYDYAVVVGWGLATLAVVVLDATDRLVAALKPDGPAVVAEVVPTSRPWERGAALAEHANAHGGLRARL